MQGLTHPCLGLPTAPTPQLHVSAARCPDVAKTQLGGNTPNALAGEREDTRQAP